MLKLDTIDSTNNYAMQLIDADKAEHGLVILADEQTAGKGQRGKHWNSTPGDTLLMTVIARPLYQLHQQPQFLAAVAVAVADEVQRLVPHETVRIKWPNDIIIGDKKAGGILIENIVRGQVWQWAVIGIGLNVGQQAFPESLPYATSIQIDSNEHFSIDVLATRLRESILAGLDAGGDILEAYNERLYRRGNDQYFKYGNSFRRAMVCGMNDYGQLIVRHSDGTIQQYTHGTVEWVWR